MLFKNLRHHLVTGCPIVNIRQKRFYPGNAVFKILLFRKDKSMKLVLFKIVVRRGANLGKGVSGQRGI